MKLYLKRIYYLLVATLIVLVTLFPTQILATESSVIFGVRNYADSYYVNGENVSRETYYTKLVEEINKCGNIANITYDDETENAQSKYDTYVLSGYTPINDKEDVKSKIKDFCNTITGPSEIFIVTTSGISTDEIFEITSVWPPLGNQCTLYGYVHHYSSYVSSSKAYNSVKSIIIQRQRYSLADGYEEALAMAKDIVEPIRSKDRYSQIKYVYEYLCNNISKLSGRTSTFKNAFIDKSSDSNGYALAFQACMEELNIPSYYLTECEGSWNVVQIDEKWYWVDAASGDKSSSIDYKYLLCGTNVKTATTDLTVSNSSYKSTSEDVVTPTYTYKDVSKTMYAKKAVNVRDLPSSTGSKVGKLEAGAEVVVTGQCKETNWYRIEYNGQEAYVSNNYLVNEKPIQESLETETQESSGETESDIPSEEPSEVESEPESDTLSEEPSEVESEPESDILSEEPSEIESEQERDTVSESITNDTEEMSTQEKSLSPPKNVNIPFITTGIIAIVGIGGVGFIVWKKNNH